MEAKYLTATLAFLLLLSLPPRAYSFVSQGHSFEWSQNGTIHDSSCINVYADNSSYPSWPNNFLCSGTNNLSDWLWSTDGPVAQMGCARWFSSAPGWEDNWLCAPVGKGPSYIFTDAPIPRSDCIEILEDKDPEFGTHYLCSVKDNMLHTYIDGAPISIEYMSEIHTFIHSDGIISYFTHSDHKLPDHMVSVPYAFTASDVCVTVFHDRLYVFYLDHFGQGTLWLNTFSQGNWSEGTAVPVPYALSDRPSCLVYLGFLYTLYVSPLGNLSSALYDGSQWVQGPSSFIGLGATNLSCVVHNATGTEDPSILCFYSVNDTSDVAPQTQAFYHAYDGFAWTGPTALEGSSNMGSSPVPLSINGEIWLFHTKANSSTLTYSIYATDPQGNGSYPEVALVKPSLEELGVTASSPSLTVLGSGALYCTYQEGQSYSPPGQMSYVTMDSQGFWNYSLALNVDAPIAIAITSDPQFAWCDDNAPTTYLCGRNSPSSTKERYGREFISSQYGSLNTLVKSTQGATPMGVFVTGDITNAGDKDGHLGVMKGLIATLPGVVRPVLGNHDYENYVNTCNLGQCAGGMIDWLYDTYLLVPKGISYDFKNQSINNGFLFTGSMAYSYNIGSYHFVHMSNYPTYTVYFLRPTFGFTSVYDMTSAVPWLTNDLNAAAKRRDKIVLSYHAPGNSTGGTASGDWNNTSFYQLIRQYDVVAVFTGHYHQEIAQQEWIDPVNKRIPRFSVGSPTYLTYSLMVTNPQARAFQYAAITNDLESTFHMKCSSTYPSA